VVVSSIAGGEGSGSTGGNTSTEGVGTEASGIGKAIVGEDDGLVVEGLLVVGAEVTRTGLGVDYRAREVGDSVNTKRYKERI